VAVLELENKKPTTYRRIVTANQNGKSVIQSDEEMEAYQFEIITNYEHTLIWMNSTTPDLSKEQQFDHYPESVVPGPGGTSLHFVTFPQARFLLTTRLMAKPPAERL